MAGADQAGADGVTRIVEVGAKPETAREATAEAWLHTTPEALEHLVADTKKRSPIECAKIVDAAVDWAEQQPYPAPEEVTRDVYYEG